jgi:hypothetical protein
MTEMTVEAARSTQRRTMWSVALLIAALLLGAGAMLMPYSAGVSRQHSSALNYWFSGCAEDDGEAWSQEPVNLGEQARQDCRAGAIARTAVAAGAITSAGVVMLLVEAVSLRRTEADS